MFILYKTCRENNLKVINPVLALVLLAVEGSGFTAI